MNIRLRDCSPERVPEPPLPSSSDCAGSWDYAASTHLPTPSPVITTTLEEISAYTGLSGATYTFGKPSHNIQAFTSSL